MLLVLASSALAGVSDQAFFNGNRLYEKGDYAGAVAEYEKVLSMGLESGNLYYNMGNAYVKEGRLAEAILSYRRARRLMPRDGDLEANLGYAELSVKDTFSSPRRNFFMRILNRFASLMTVNELAGLSSSVLILFWAVAMASLLLRGFREKLGKLALIVLLVFLVSASLTAYKLYADLFHLEGVIMRDRVEVRYSPTADGTVAFNLHKGSRVGILRRRNGWVQVGLPGGKSGWIESDAVQAVREAPFDRSRYRFEVIDSKAAPPGDAGAQRP